MKLLFSILLCFSIGNSILSQSVGNYAFSASSGTFTALSGATNPALTSGDVDDGYFNAIPLGFTFIYMGTSITTISASTNGWLSAGGANITNSTFGNNLSNAGAPRPLIAPLWDDIDLQVATNLSYKTTGSAGSRVFTIQYLNCQWDFNATGNTISFQVKLYETSGNIEFIYRQEAGTLNNGSGGASIGLTASGTGNGNYLSLNNSSASPTAATNVNTTNIATKPATGQVYTFTPPATPNAPTNLTFSSILTTTYTLNWTDASNETGYRIYRSTDGVNFTFQSQVAANTTSFNATGLTANTLYYWNVTSVNEGKESAPLNNSQLTATATTISTTGGGSIVIPCGVTSITVEARGAGGGGGNSANASSRGGSGGGGGGYAIGTHTVTGGSTYFYYVGAGGAGAPANSTTAAIAGEDTWFRATANTNVAPTTNAQGTLGDGGGFGLNNSNVATSGGTANLGNQSTTNGSNGAGGVNAGGGNGGAGANGGGAGGAGSTSTNGSPGSPVGGGGGGSNDAAAHAGGAGARGELILYYAQNVSSVAPTSVSATTSSSCNTSFSTTLTQNGGTLGTGAVWKWYTSSCGGTLVGTSYAANASITLTVTSTTTYYVRAEGGACGVTTACASATCTVQALPTASDGGSNNVFVGESTTITTASSSNGTIVWTHNGTGAFDEVYFPVGNQYTNTPTYYTEEGDFGQTVTLTMTVTGLGACSAQTATATHTFVVDGRPALWTYQCGTTLNTVNDYVYAYAYPGATQYRFRVNDGVTTQTYDTPASVFYFALLPTFQYGTTYTCDVAVFVSGAWTAYGPTCNITTPTLPHTTIQASQCGTILATLNTPIYADLVEDATGYRFRVTNGVSTQIFDNPSRMFNLTQFTGFAYGTTYTIDVAVNFNGWQTYGSTCTVTTPSSPAATITGSLCGTTLANMDVDILCDEVPGATTYRFKLVNGGTTLTLDKPSRTFKFSQVSGIMYGTTYAVSVATQIGGSFGAFGATCNITSPGAATTQIIASQCGTVLTDIQTDLLCNEVVGATTYRFRVANTNGTVTIDKPSRTFKLAQLSNVLYSGVNTIDVNVLVNGSWSGFGPTCNVTSPSTPSSAIIASLCNTTIGTGALIIATEVPGATQYRFRLTNGGPYTTIKTARVVRLTDFTGIATNTTYSMDVDVFYAGAWQGYGSACNITTPGTLIYGNDVDEINDAEIKGFEDSTSTLLVSELNPIEQVRLYPNPFESELIIDFTHFQLTDNTEVLVYDGQGKLIESLIVNELSKVRVGANYEHGLYYIKVRNDLFEQTYKAVKN